MHIAQMHAAPSYRSAEGEKVAPDDTKFERYTWVQHASECIQSPPKGPSQLNAD